MSTLIKRLLLCFILILFSAHDAHAGRFGLQTGLYKDRLGNRNSCAGSTEVGLRLGFYADKTTHDLIYASAMNGFDLCQVLGTCPGNGNLAPRVAPPCLCSVSTPSCCQPPAPVGCSSSALPPPAQPVYQQQPQPQMVMQAPAAPTYYPQQAPSVSPTIAPTISVVQQPAAPAPVQQAAPKTEVYLLVMPNQQQQQPMSYQAPQQPSYYREPISYGGAEYQQPVRGLW